MCHNAGMIARCNACLLLAGCASEAPGPPAGDHGRGDAAGDSSAGDTGSGDELVVREPQAHVLTCQGGGPTTFYDTDHVCAVPALGVQIYVQATPTSCVTLIGERPYFDDVTGWVKRGGRVTEIPAAYDAGHHGNDVLHVEIDSTVYVVWHSSFGYGWRSCAPPDCLMTCNAGATFASCGPSTAVAEDGCARDSGDPPPPSPVTCVRVESSGELPDLLDPWDVGPGDPYPLLPCPGDV